MYAEWMKTIKLDEIDLEAVKIRRKREKKKKTPKHWTKECNECGNCCPFKK